MAHQFFQPIAPVSQPEAEIFELYQHTHYFYREVQQRQALEEYCQWYYKMAAEHRRDLEMMRREVNIMSWFRRS